MSEHYSISDLATEFGITPRTIRFYEDHDLLAPERDGQRRIYSRRDRGRLAWVLRAKRVGFSLSEIADMLDLYDLDDDRAQQRHVTLEMCRKQLQDLEFSGTIWMPQSTNSAAFVTCWKNLRPDKTRPA